MSGQELELLVDLASPVPVYEQVRLQVTELVESGALAPGYVLPSVRQLAADFGVAPGTVARAYRELKGTGVVTTSRLTGTRIADVPRLAPATRLDRLNEAVERLVGAARRLGVTEEELRAALESVLGREAGDE